MKFLLILSIFLSCSFSALAEQSLPVLACKSNEVVEGWDGSATEDYVRYTAYVESDTKLVKAVINGAFKTDMRDLVADLDSENKYNRSRFSTLEDAWCWFNLLTPKNLSAQTSSFKGTVQYLCEEQFSYTYIDMNCFLKR